MIEDIVTRIGHLSKLGALPEPPKVILECASDRDAHRLCCEILSRLKLETIVGYNLRRGVGVGEEFTLNGIKVEVRVRGRP